MPFLTSVSNLSLNLKMYRETLGLSQNEVAAKSGISSRLYQQLEAGEGNPTVETLSHLATSLKVTPCRLLQLSSVRTKLSASQFFSKFKDTFADVEYAVGLRDRDGNRMWTNIASKTDLVSKALGAAPIGMDDSTSIEAKGILRNQIVCEREGIVYPYTNFNTDSSSGEVLYFRYYPTVVIPEKGRSICCTALYFCDPISDNEQNYYEYSIKMLLAAN